MATFLDSLMGGMQLGQAVRGLQDQGNINRLAGQAANSSGMERTSALNQMWGVNPQMASQQETALGASEDRRNKGMVQAARMLSSAPEAMRPGLYQQMKPMLSQYGLQLPEQYDQTVADAANSLVQAYGGASDAMPSGLRQFQGIANAAGLSPGSEEYQRAARVNLGLEGRASGAGYSLVKFKGADGRERIGTLSGATGQISMPDGSTFDPRSTGVQFTAVEESASPQGSGQLDFVSDFQQFQQSGIPVSSTVRSEQRNREVGGTANSYHLTGEALDIAPRNAQEKAAAQQYWQSRGYQVIDEGDHLHVEPPSRGMTASRLGQQLSPASSGSTFVGRSAEEEAAAVEQAKANVQLNTLPAELGMRTQAAINQAVGIDEGKSQTERASNARAKAPQLLNVERGLRRISTALDGLKGMLVDTGPIDGLAMQYTQDGQELEAAVGAIQNDMLALTRVPGIGSQSDLEAKIANLKYPSIYNHPEVNRRNVEQLNAFIADLEDSLGVSGRGSQASGRQSESRQPVQRARNPQTGEVVEYRNGQWVKVQ